MDTRIIDGLEFDECPQCHGIWFDQGEFDLARKIIAPDLQWLDFEIWQHPERFKVKPHPLNCPRCGLALLAIN
jgi:Zn-finger nucleic acid-binding protein